MMSTLWHWYLVFIIYGILPYLTENRKSVQIRNVFCEEEDRNFAVFDECKLKAVRRDLTYVNVRLRIIKKPINSIFVDTTLSLRDKHNTPPLVHFKIDYCEFLRNKRRNPFAQTFYKLYGLENCSNFNHPCPYDHDFVADKCRWEDKHSDLIVVPPGDYRLLTTWLVNQRPLVNFTLIVKIVERK